jgi:SOS-response transcriptional repressor LexA
MIGLTKRQADLLAFLTEYDAEHGISPKFEEMRLRLGIASKSGVHRLLGQLEERGHIRRLHHRHRAIEIITPAPRMPTRADLARATDDELARYRTDLAAEIGKRLQDTAFARADGIMGVGR